MSAHRHAGIVQAITTGDPLTAVHAVEEHMTDTIRTLVGSDIGQHPT